MLALSSTLSSPSPLFRSALNLVRGQHQVGHGLSGSERQVGDMASDRRAMLEPVTAAASDDPAIAPLRVPVDQQVTIVAILILAYARLGDGAPGDIRETGRGACRERGG